MSAPDRFSAIRAALDTIDVRNHEGRPVTFAQAISGIVKLIAAQGKKGDKVILIGNGGSASIASHVAIDLLKNAGIPALAFNDASFLTCLANDLGFEAVFAEPLDALGRKGDVLIAVSSSGRSKNILQAARRARAKGLFVITLSGFTGTNPLRKLGDVNFHVSSREYGTVEIAHLAICHAIVDQLVLKSTHG